MNLFQCRNKAIILTVSLLCFSSLWADAVIGDKGTELSKKELAQALNFIPENMTKDGIADESARLQIVRDILVNKKIAEAASKITEEENPRFYWKRFFYIQKALNDFTINNYKDTIPVPDVTALAREQYKVNRDRFAKVPEIRGSSHILFKCMVGCDRKALRPKVEKVFAELKEGADFEEMVQKHSEDLNSKAKKGKVGNYYLGQPHVNDRYTTSLFNIEKIGDISEITESRFGFHIIRLDSIKESFIKPFEEIEKELTEKIVNQYQKLAVAEYLKSFELSDDTKIDTDLINSIFAEKKKQMELEEAKKPKRKLLGTFK